MFAICTVSLTAAHIDKHKNIFLAGVRPITIPWNYINFRPNLCWVTGTYTAYTKSHSYLLPTGTDSYCSKALSLSLFHWKLVLTWFFFFPLGKEVAWTCWKWPCRCWKHTATSFGRHAWHHTGLECVMMKQCSGWKKKKRVTLLEVKLSLHKLWQALAEREWLTVIAREKKKRTKAKKKTSSFSSRERMKLSKEKLEWKIYNACGNVIFGLKL